ncbi:MAG: hypothetical protein L7V86_16955 [Verrucomicrobiales bacterium]|nr:hypothetical protein [Verrucomicrobiales bacterium]
MGLSFASLRLSRLCSESNGVLIHPSLHHFPAFSDGGAGATQLRTWIDLRLLAGVPHDQWRSSSFLVWPFLAFVPKAQMGLRSRDQTRRKSHPLNLALEWREVLDSNPVLTTREIADDQGITPSRVRQILRLSTLAPVIIDELTSMNATRLAHFGEARLRKLVPLPTEDQIERFRELQR